MIKEKKEEHAKTPEQAEDEQQAESYQEEVTEGGIRLAFPEAAVVRVMKRHLDKEKMIKKETKIMMNKWLESMCAAVSKTMNKFPYVMMTKSEFKEGTRVYDHLKHFDTEKLRILSHLDAMKKDIEKLERDLGKAEEEIMEIS
ncbi:MAG: hypothetical protein JRI49_04965 [Deltaproteobacteria bacterium]|nr:hypothetical protein [Deltaproteobacteria bacterium]